MGREYLLKVMNNFVILMMVSHTVKIMPLNCTLKMENFITYINIYIYICHNKKETNTNIIIPMYHSKKI